jgi:hypothetical protein
MPEPLLQPGVDVSVPIILRYFIAGLFVFWLYPHTKKIAACGSSYLIDKLDPVGAAAGCDLF